MSGKRGFGEKRRMKRIIILCLILFSFTNCVQDNISEFSGTIYEQKSYIPIENVKVTFDEVKYVYSDSKGFFKFEHEVPVVPFGAVSRYYLPCEFSKEKYVTLNGSVCPGDSSLKYYMSKDVSGDL